MATWQVIPTVSDGYNADRAYWRKLFNNLRMLQKVSAQSVQVSPSNTNYAVPSTTYTNINSTEGTLVFESTGRDVLLGYSLRTLPSSTTSILYSSLLVDGVAYGQQAGNFGLLRQATTAGVNGEMNNYWRIIPGLAAGTHTMVIQVKFASSPVTLLHQFNATVGYTPPPMMYAFEV